MCRLSRLYHLCPLLYLLLHLLRYPLYLLLWYLHLLCLLRCTPNREYQRL